MHYLLPCFPVCKCLQQKIYICFFQGTVQPKIGGFDSYQWNLLDFFHKSLCRESAGNAGRADTDHKLDAITAQLASMNRTFCIRTFSS